MDEKNIVTMEEITTIGMFNQNVTKNAMIFAAELAASNDMVPHHYQGKPSMCLVAMFEAARYGMSAPQYMAVTYPVNGKIGFEAKFIIAQINKSGLLKGPLRFEFSGEIIRGEKGNVLPTSTRKCISWGILRETGEKIEFEFDIKTAFLEGWMSNPKIFKWHTMTEMMMMYRSASFFGKMYCPEIVMGMYTRDELEDIQDAEAIEISETAKEIFEDGSDVKSDPDPVIDPSEENVEKKEDVSEKQVAEDAEYEEVPEIKPETAPHDAKVATSNKTHDEIPKEPPQGATVAEFREWISLRFFTELDYLTDFLRSKKWISTGEDATDMNDKLMADLMSMWDKFIPAYEKYKIGRGVK